MYYVQSTSYQSKIIHGIFDMIMQYFTIKQNHSDIEFLVKLISNKLYSKINFFIALFD